MTSFVARMKHGHGTTTCSCTQSIVRATEQMHFEAMSRRSATELVSSDINDSDNYNGTGR